MPRPTPPPLEVDESLIAKTDEMLLRSRMALASALNSWFNAMKLSYRQIEQLSALACGRSRIPPATITRIRRAAVDPAHVFRPQPETLVALGDMNRLVDDLVSERIPTPRVFREMVHRLKPLLRVDGELLTAEDMARVLVGAEGILEPIQVVLPDADRLERLVSNLGPVIERAMFDAGRSPLRDLSALLALYPLPEERQLLRRVIEGDALLTPQQMNEMLPGLAYALSRFTGESWDRGRLLDAVPPIPVGQ